MEKEKPKTITELFWVSIVVKAIASAGEMLAGIASVLIPNTYALHLALIVTRSYIDGDADDFIARGVVHAAHAFAASNNISIGIYLFIRGFIQFLLVIALFKNKLWAYPVLVVVLSLLVLSQLYALYFSHSLATGAITLLDIVTIFLVVREYRIVRTVRKEMGS